MSEKCFGVAGKAWAAIKDGKIVAIVAMNAHGVYTAYSPEVLAAAGVTRYCPAAVRMAEQMNADAFQAHREKSRAELAKLGNVVSGVASCGEFVYGDKK